MRPKSNAFPSLDTLAPLVASTNKIPEFHLEQLNFLVRFLDPDSQFLFCTVVVSLSFYRVDGPKRALTSHLMLCCIILKRLKGHSVIQCYRKSKNKVFLNAKLFCCHLNSKSYSEVREKYSFW